MPRATIIYELYEFYEYKALIVSNSILALGSKKRKDQKFINFFKKTNINFMNFMKLA